MYTRITLTTLGFFLVSLLSAQTSFQVVSKVIEEEFPYSPGYEVNIEGERAEILVDTWDKQSVKVVMEIISKHPDKSIAERDLEAVKYSIEQHGQQIYFRNYISQDSGQPKPESQLKTIYTVYLPAECPVYLKNYFGEANVSNLERMLRLQSEFTAIFLKNLHGETKVDSRFGDITGDGLNGIVSITTHRSDITLMNLTGDFDIHSKFGVIKLFTDESLVNMNIEAERSDVYFFDPHPTRYGYLLTAHYGTITAPLDLKFNYLENTQPIKQAVFNPGGETGTISVKISFGDIIIRNP
ncbi:MAG: DUF4097 family beta strand repeat protein [Saprospiraceae bacterium]|nr:DUF4097 family beta strand repeat protein [Saprospiraceae bacterium]